MSPSRNTIGMVAAGIVDVTCAVGEGFGIPHSELPYVAALEAKGRGLFAAFSRTTRRIRGYGRVVRLVLARSEDQARRQEPR